MNPTEIFENSLKLPDFLLRVCGSDYNLSQNTWMEKFKNGKFFIFNMAVLLIAMFAEAKAMADRNHPFNKLTFAFTCIGFSTIAISKVVFLLKNQHKVVFVLNKLKYLHPNVNNKKHDKKSFEFKLNNDIFNAMNNMNFIIKLVFYTNLVLYIAVMSTPLLLMLYFYVRSGEIFILYPLITSYPFDITDPRFFILVYPIENWAGAFTLAGIAGSDTLFYAFCTFILIQFKILAYRIRTIVERSKYDTGEVNEELLFDNLRDLIKQHQDIISLIETIDSVYSKSMLVQYSLSSVLICLCGFNLSVTKDFSLFFSFLFALLSCQCQIFILCYFGDMITTSSSQISEDIYHCEWVVISPKFRRILLIMIIRAQKTCKFTAHKFADVNLKTFTAILGSSYSYFALLKTMYAP